MSGCQNPRVSSARASSRGFGLAVLLTVVGKVAFAAAGALIVLVVARELGPAGQGRFAVALNLTLLLIQLGSLGLTGAHPYFAAREPGLHGALVANSFLLGAGAGAGLVLAVVALKLQWPQALPGLGWTELLVTLAGIPAALVALFLQGVLLGRQRIVAYTVVDVVPPVAALVTIAVGFLALDFRILEVLVVMTASRLLGVGLAVVAVVAGVPGRPAIDRAVLARVLRHGGRIWVVTLVTFVLIRLDLLLVNALLGPEDAGLYSIAALVAEALILLPSVIGLNLLPRAATAEDAGETALVFRLVAAIFAVIVVLSVAAVAVGFPLVFGQAYERSRELYYWLAPAVFFLGLLMVLSAHYSAGRYPSHLIGAWVAGLALNCVLNVLLLPEHGPVVASISSTIAYGVVLGAHMAAFVRDTGSARQLVPRPGESVRSLVALLPQRLRPDAS